MRIEAVMPTYNQAEWLEAAVDSVSPQVDRLVIVNDASTDNTTEVLAGLSSLHTHFKIVNNGQNVGTAKAINTGIDLFDKPGDKRWWTWVSSDNTLSPHWRKTIEKYARSDVGVIYTAYWYARPNQKPWRHFKEHEPDRLINDENCYYGPSFVIRSEVWYEVGDHRGAISHDYDHWLRVEEVCKAKELKIIGINDPLCRYNAHDKRRTITEKHTYDARKWQEEARRRRGLCV